MIDIHHNHRQFAAVKGGLLDGVIQLLLKGAAIGDAR